MMKYCLVREDGLFLGRRPNGRWYYTTSPSAACRLPPVEALTALHACIQLRPPLPRPLRQDRHRIRLPLQAGSGRLP